jgi:hypothetical protein
MPDDERDQRDKRPTQRTPKGLEIPIPTRGEFMDAIRKVSKPEPDDGDVGDECSGGP